MSEFVTRNRVSRPEYDIVILGGGLAGLSLGVRLAALPHLRTLILEPREAYVRDRTWCYWRLHDHPFGDAVAARWTRWEALQRNGSGDVRRAVQDSALLPYEMIPADRLYAHAQEVIASAPHVELRMGAKADAVRDLGDRVEVETQTGRIDARLVFDSRPPVPRAGALEQIFLGQEIVAAEPVFDPGRVTLMDFAVPQQPGAVHFLYVLPTSTTTALVEDTWLAPSSAALPDYRTTIRTYLRERFGLTDYSVTFEETGAIPMDTELQAEQGGGRIVKVGAAGGAVKPSSGYAFLATQRMADRLVADLAAGRPIRPVQPRSAVARWMDDVLLTALRRQPEVAPRLFASLFARCRPEPLVRFLNDVGSASDTARVIAAMPKLPMIAAFAAHLRGQ